MKDYLRYWGKTGNDGGYHLLAYHCLDVAAVGYSLLTPDGGYCRRLAQGLDIDPDQLQRWFVFCLSLHDLGKFATSFQGLAPNMSDRLVQQISTIQYTERHDTLGFMLWQDYLMTRWFNKGAFGLSPESAQLKLFLRAMIPWLEIVTGHHGIPPKIAPVRYKDFFTEYDENAAFDYCLAVANLFISPHEDLSFIADKSFKTRLKPQSWLLAGLVVLSDWIGSSIDTSAYYSTTMDLNHYWHTYALPSAAMILDRLDLAPADVSPFSGTRHLFPFIREATPLQAWADTAELDAGPQLILLEDATGAGKTEAALTIGHRLMAAGLADGIYMALPTMATANAMYQRLGAAYRRLFADSATKKPSLVLAHGARHLSEAFRVSVGLPEAVEKADSYTSGEDTGESYCSAWLADSRKKALLAEIGVGTIDQALLSVLPARHQSLRLLGLSHKVLIADEIHSYDPYVNQLLQNLLEAHARNGGSAILLSATLPQNMREAYASAFCMGARLQPPQLSSAPAYPLITHIPSPVHPETPIETRREAAKKVSVRMLSDLGQVLAVIEACVKQGRCVCWIRNTVKDAGKAFDLLAGQSWIDKTKLRLFHSRFAMIDRNRIEAGTIAGFGKDSGAEIRCGRVLVATQVVEQSLDLDFDILISDLAPIDLLIQRAGRLHRHIRDAAGNPILDGGGTDRRGRPTFYIFGPEPSEAPPSDWLKAVLPGTQAVYPHVGLVWLTQKRLVETGAINIPEDARRLIEGVYGDAAQDEIPDALQEISFDAEGDDSGKRGMARLNALDLSKGYTRSSSEDIDGWAEDTHVPTRLSEETVTVALARFESGELIPYAGKTEFAWELSMLHLPMREWQAVHATFSRETSALIKKVKEDERGLKWAEVLPLTAETQAHYDSEMGWHLSKEGADESD